MNSSKAIKNPWLTLVRVVWLLTAPLNLTLSLASLPSYYLQLLNLVPPSTNVGWTQTTFSSAVAAARLPAAAAAWLVLLPELVNIVVFAAIGGLIFWRKSDQWIGLLSSYVMIGLAGTFTGNGLLSIKSFPAPWDSVIYGIGVSVWLFFFLFLCLFPDGRFEPHWVRWVVVLFILWFIPESIQQQNGLVHNLLNTIVYIFPVLFLVGQVYRYFKISTPEARQQTRWFLFALSIFVPLALTSTYFEQAYLFHLAPTPAKLWLYFADQIITGLSFTLFPIAIGIALFRYKLWNIDLIIRRALVYGTLTASLGLIYFGGVVLLEQIFHGLTGQASPLAVVISTLVIAALFNPLRNGLQSVIDRRFYRNRYNASLALEAFSSVVRSEVEILNLSKQLVSVVKDTVQPVQVSLWLLPAREQRSTSDFSDSQS